ncbi:MAG: hypothetical protein M1822_007558 [Bathelium mastoideum]|nr:MAG: hypothetical protein M1822_007558 [Bathelium mastoideum]
MGWISQILYNLLLLHLVNCLAYGAYTTNNGTIPHRPKPSSSTSPKKSLETSTSRLHTISSDTIGIGDYVASGLGATRSNSVSLPTPYFAGNKTNQREGPGNSPASWPTAFVASPSSLVPQSKLASSHVKHPVTSTNISNASVLSRPEITATAPQSLHKSVVSSNSSFITAPFPSAHWRFNSSVNGSSSHENSTDQCWSQWENYYSLLANSYDDMSTYQTYDTYATVPTTQIGTFSASPPTTQTITIIATETSTIVEGGFPLSTETWTSTDIWTSSGSEYSGTTYTDIFSIGLVSTEMVTVSGAPNCSLPSSLSQCQTSWEAFASDRLLTIDIPLPSCFQATTVGACATSWNNYWSSWRSLDNPTYQSKIGINSPLCSQASLGSSLCNALRSSYASAGYDLYNQPVTNRIIGTDYTWTYTDFPNINSWENVAGYSVRVTQNSVGNIVPVSSYWPSASPLAPGCSLGCGGCAITGGTIDLIHWPATIDTSADANSNGEIVVTAFGTELTYPTVYVSFSDLHAADSCSRVGSSYSSTIVPITALNQLSSIWVDGDALGAQTAFFNLSDLNPPIPLSIYSRQPWCAVFSNEWYASPNSACQAATALPNNTACTPVCPQTRPYEPILVLPSGVLQSIDPAWASCSLDLRGNYDPPYLLTPQAAAAIPTAPPVFSAAPAPQPASNPALGAPTPKPTLGAPAPQSEPTLGGGSTGSVVRPTAGGGSQEQGGGSGNGDTGASASGGVGGDAGSSDPGLGTGSGAESNSGGESGSAASGDGNESGVSGGTRSGNGGGNQGGEGGSGSADESGGERGGSGSGSNPGTDEPGRGPAFDSGSGGAEAASNAIGVLGQQGSGAGSGSSSSGSEAGLSGAQGGTAVGKGDSHGSGSGGSDENAGGSGDVGSEGGGLGDGGLGNQGSSTGESGSADPGSGASEGSENGVSAADPNLAGVQIGGQLGQADPAGSGIIIGGQAFQPGALATVGGTHISVGSHGTVVVDGTTTILPTPAVESLGGASGGQAPPAAVFTIDGTTYTAHAGRPLIVAGTTLNPQSPGAIIDGQKVSMEADGVVVDNQTVPFSLPGSAAILTLSGTPYTASALPSSPNAVLILGPGGVLTTLSIGGPAFAVAGEAISAVAGGIEVGTSFEPFQVLPTQVRTEAQFTGTDGAVWTAIEESNPAGTGEVVILEGDGRTVTIEMGEKATSVDGETVSAGSEGVIVDGRTIAWTRVTAEPGDSWVSRPSAAIETGTSSTSGIGGLASHPEPTATGAASRMLTGYRRILVTFGTVSCLMLLG